ncbi:MAG: hypothetical protein E6H01_13515 [Bacillati bacterium ANGP1]|uniref:Uncharacterized protein n=1 Tax=Candidatus Segetimicrobium genomatis TaxID=2569760 RepID=A0A537KMP6_9BACT|nr:MAG: hypothetical protein E6H01_13515 [Terrabacteria group bacterium ANGP1]
MVQRSAFPVSTARQLVVVVIGSESLTESTSAQVAPLFAPRNGCPVVTASWTLVFPVAGMKKTVSRVAENWPPIGPAPATMVDNPWRFVFHCSLSV